ncbi:MAG: response regulator transcription factor [Acidobacteria bacterium]|nr:response regulator transcription factor [Acidobacteriota bacterium]
MRMLICDDHTLFREGIKSILSGDPSIEVIGEAADGRQAVEYTGRLHPDVILMDVSMPEMIGYEAIRRISKADKNVKILVLTMYEEEEIIGLCLNAGASGYILKDAPAGQLIEAIHIVHEGGKYLSPRAMQKVVNQYIDGSAPLETKYDTLSNREREILKLLADGLSVKDIASRLNLSVKTIDVHKYNLMRKLDLHDKTDLIKYALRRNLISFPAVTHLESHKK